MSEGEGLTVRGIPVRCRHCGSYDVTEGGANLEHVVPGAEDPARTLRAFVCEGCGSVQLFLSPARVGISPDGFPCPSCGADLPRGATDCPICGRHEEVVAAPPTFPGESEPCLACGARMGPGVDDCPACGWTFETGTPDDEVLPPPPPPPIPEEPEEPSLLETPSVVEPAPEVCANCGAPRIPEAGICRSCGRLYDG